MSRFRVAAAAVFVLLGVLAAIQGWVGWAFTERSLREKLTLPGPTLGLVLVAGVVVAVVQIFIGFVLV